MAAAVLEDEHLLLQAEEGRGGHSMKGRAGRQAGGANWHRVLGKRGHRTAGRDSSGEGTPLEKGLLRRGDSSGEGLGCEGQL